MNIVINAVLAFEQPRGVGRYINNLLPALAEIDTENEYYVYYGKWMQQYSFLSIRQPNFHFIELDIANNQIQRNLYLAVVFPVMIRKHDPDVLFLVDTQAILVKTCPIVSTIHDLAEFVVPEKYSKKQAFIRRMLVRLQVRLSDRIMTVSEYSQKDLCSRFGLPAEKVAVVYNAVDKVIDSACLREPEDYFLFVSETERAKNLPVLLRAYACLPEEYRRRYSVKVVGKKGNDYENIQNIIRENHIEDRVEMFGFVDDQALEALYSGASAFVFPSLFEGFGLPVLEAMAAGVPVICSNAASIPEVGGDAVLTFDPMDHELLSRHLRTVIEDQALRREMIGKGLKRAALFTRESAARGTLEVLQG